MYILKQVYDNGDYPEEHILYTSKDKQKLEFKLNQIVREFDEYMAEYDIKYKEFQEEFWKQANIAKEFWIKHIDAIKNPHRPDGLWVKEKYKDELDRDCFGIKPIRFRASGSYLSSYEEPKEPQKILELMSKHEIAELQMSRINYIAYNARNIDDIKNNVRMDLINVDEIPFVTIQFTPITQRGINRNDLVIEEIEEL